MSGDEEGQLARFAVESNKIKSNVKYHLFKPAKNKKKGRWEVSVSRIDGLDHNSIKTIGKGVADERGKKLYGWARLTEGVVSKTSLSIEDDSNKERHANLIGWPENEGEWIDHARTLAGGSDPILIS